MDVGICLKSDTNIHRMDVGASVESDADIYQPEGDGRLQSNADIYLPEVGLRLQSDRDVRKVDVGVRFFEWQWQPGPGFDAHAERLCKQGGSFGMGFSHGHAPCRSLFSMRSDAQGDEGSSVDVAVLVPLVGAGRPLGTVQRRAAWLQRMRTRGGKATGCSSCCRQRRAACYYKLNDYGVLLLYYY